MTSRILLLLLLSVNFVACENEQEEKWEERGLKLVAFKPNQCNEPWDGAGYRTSEAPSRPERLKNYLRDNGISQITNFEITIDNKIYCEACSCLSGENVKFTVTISDFEKLKTIAPFDNYLK